MGYEGGRFVISGLDGLIGQLMNEPVVGKSGNHSARLLRFAENFSAVIQGAGSPLIMMSRLGTFSRELSYDLRSGSISSNDVATLFDHIAGLGEWAFGVEMRPPLRRSLCEPIPEIFGAASDLQEAVRQHNLGHRKRASELFSMADSPKVRAFTDHGWGKGAAARYGFLVLPDAPPFLPKLLRPLPRMPNLEVRKKILARDTHHCRFCGIPVIAPEVRKRIQAIYPNVVGWGTKNISQHAAFQCMWMQFDHLLPNSRGGESSPENIVIACAVCNFGRMQATLEEARLFNPLDFDLTSRWPGFGKWDGLSSFDIIVN